MIIKPSDLLKLAGDHVDAADRDPVKQDFLLRQAVSGSYYAVFHALTAETVRYMLGNRKMSDPLCANLRRKVSHSALVNACSAIRSGKNEAKIIGEIFAVCAQNSQLQTFCGDFCDLQEARHDADYNHRVKFQVAPTKAHLRAARSGVRYITNQIDNPCAGSFFTLIGREFTAKVRS